MPGSKSVGPPSRPNKTVGVRLPDPLRVELEKSAAANGTNLSQEIIRRLNDSIESEGMLLGVQDEIDELTETARKLTEQANTLKKTLLAYINGTIEFPGNTPQEKARNMATFLGIQDDPDVQQLLWDDPHADMSVPQGSLAMSTSVCSTDIALGVDEQQAAFETSSRQIPDHPDYGKYS